MSFEVTARAAQRIQAAAREGEAQPPVLRVAAKRREDGSIEYALGFDEATAQDARVSADGVTVVIAPQSLPLLEGATLDFVEISPGEFQFIFLNPNDPHYIPPSEP